MTKLDTSYRDLTSEQVAQLIASEDPVILRDSNEEIEPTLPKGQPVIIDGFVFLNFTYPLEAASFLYEQGKDGQSIDPSQGYPWPSGTQQKLEQFIRTIRKIEEKTGERFSPFIPINDGYGENDLGFSMGKDDRLIIGYGELFNPTSNDELDAVLLHELAHKLHGDGNLPLDKIGDGLMIENWDYYLPDYQKNPDQRIERLSWGTQSDIAKNLGEIKLNNECYREYVTRLHEYLIRSPHFTTCVDSILYDMETGGDALRQHFKGTPADILQELKNKADPESLPNVGLVTEPEAIKAFLDEEVAKNAAVQFKALEIQAVIKTIRHAQEIRADRYMVRHADNPLAGLNYFKKNTPPESIDGAGTHPSLMKRTKEIMNTSAGCMIDKWTASGGFADELHQSAIDHLTAVFKGNNHQPVFPHRGPETLAGQVKYGKWTENICSNPTNEKGIGK